VIKAISRPIVENIERLNALRNGMAQSFLPENRRAAALSWKGQDMFSVAGSTAMSDDMALVFEHLDQYAPPSARVWKPFE